MKRKIAFGFVFFVFLWLNTGLDAYSQETTIYLHNYSLFIDPLEDKSTVGNVKITQDESVERLIRKHIEYNEAQEGFPGYRVQIYFGSGQNARKIAHQTVTVFERRYDQKGYIDYEAPIFKVKVGNFRTRSEAERFKNKILKHYPNSWVVGDLIEFPDLNNDNDAE